MDKKDNRKKQFNEFQGIKFTPTKSQRFKTNIDMYVYFTH